MKYIKFDNNKNCDLNILFVYEDQLSSVDSSIPKDSVREDIKLSIENKIVSGKAGSNNMFSSRMYANNYYFIGLGIKNELTIQKYEKYLSAALREINSYKISSISIDTTNIKIRHFELIRGTITEIEKAQYSYKKSGNSLLKSAI